MGKKLASTPKSRVRSALRQLWLRSRERAAAIKREGNACEECGKKGSKAKGREVNIEVHHLEEIQWERVIEYIYRHVLVHPNGLEVLCKECHAIKTAQQRECV
jgi:predicted HNH restriction endonuclease